MSAFLLACALCCAQTPENDPLLKQLDADFQELLKTERNPQPLREAAHHLAMTNTSSNWTRYGDATAILRRTRSRAAIPLLLKYMLKHADFGTGGLTAYAVTLEFLTGKEIDRFEYSGPERAARIREAVERLANDWWKKEKDRITLDVGKMTPAQVQVITDNLLKRIGWWVQANAGERTEASDGLLAILGYARVAGRDSLYWSDDEVHPRMLPLLLARAGHVEPGGRPPQREAHRVPFEVLAPLAVLRQNGEAPGLEKVARDEGQNGAVRLTCVLALYWSGEDMDTQALLSILAKEKKLERRLLATLLLGDGPDARKAVPKLLTLMDDPNTEIRAAAIHALASTAPPEALPKLRKVLDELHPKRSVWTVLAIVGAMRTEKAKEMLATFMEGALEDPKRGEYLSYALPAFEMATGRQWRDIGPQPEEHYRQKAREALKWWRQQQKGGQQVPQGDALGLPRLPESRARPAHARDQAVSCPLPLA